MGRKRNATRRLIGAAAATAVLLAIVVPFSCIRPAGTGSTEHVADATAADGEPRLARVVLVNGEASATVAVSAPCTLTAAATEQVLSEAPSLPRATVRATARGIALGSREFACSALRLVAHRDGAIAVNGRRYRGHLVLRRTAAGGLVVLNAVPVERYLYSVLGSETYAGWPAAALEAQAIVARSYGLWRMAQRRARGFDLYAGVSDQKYLGIAAETPKTRAAVDATAGRVLLHQMKLFRCYYHSTCGGHTEAVENFFPDPHLLPLSGVPCGHCKASKHYRWRRQLSKAAIGEALRRDGVAVRRLASLEVAEQTRSGRALSVVATSATGERFTMRGSKFRVRIGPDKLPSTCFTLRERGDGYEFDGRGWGHGVGLCQWGSLGMAKAGYSSTAILRHYYPGAVVRRIYTGRGGI